MKRGAATLGWVSVGALVAIAFFYGLRENVGPIEEREVRFRDLRADTWVATDALGRSLPTSEECGPPRPGKYVGIFYFLWHGAHGEEGPFDLTKILADPLDPPFGPPGAFHHWGEPELGYYLSDDAYVFRVHASWLMDAGVDLVVIDVTNAHIYERQFAILSETWLAMRAEGIATPQIAFLAHTKEIETVAGLFETYYSDERLDELWFHWKGKPLLMAGPEGHSDEIRSFFTFRKSWAWTAAPWFGDGLAKWPWLDRTPQQPGLDERGRVEQIAVAAAEHATTNMGKSFNGGRQPPPAEQKPGEGLYFREQWDRAFEVDPSFIFITGWNEWVAQRFVSGSGERNFLVGRELKEGESYFVDAYNEEYNRDLEPMKGGYTDNLYYQMVAGIRRFKGARANEKAPAGRRIVIDGSFDDWESVRPEYHDTVGDALRERPRLWGATAAATELAGRNDFSLCKVSVFEGAASFYLELRDGQNFQIGAEWPDLWLLIDSDGDSSTGRTGYDLRVGLMAASPEGGVIDVYIEILNRAGYWKLATRGEGVVNVGCLELSFAAAGLLGSGEWMDFHWVDNHRDPNGWDDFATAGDSAPNRRANYRHVWSESASPE